MHSKRRKFDRSTGTRRYRKLFVFAVEGIKTEPQYFAIFNRNRVTVKCLRDHHRSSPLQVLERMKKHLMNEPPKAADEFWLVVDKDKWPDEHFTELHAWSQEQDNRGFVLSNPKFEYWLLLHFEDASNITSHNCSDRLKKHLPDYNKDIAVHRFTEPRIQQAIQRAKLRDSPPCTDWPRTPGGTTVYRLVKRILDES